MRFVKLGMGVLTASMLLSTATPVVAAPKTSVYVVTHYKGDGNFFPDKTVTYDKSGLIHQIKQKSPEAKIIVSTMHEEIWIVNKLKHPDIDAVVFKSSAGEYIQKALQTVLKGKKYYCPQFQKLYKEKDKIGHTPDTLDSAPTIRELDVLKAIAKGMSTHEISECLFISENTVEWHRKNLMVKFGAKNATDLVIKALSKGYLSIPLK